MDITLSGKLYVYFIKSVFKNNKKIGYEFIININKSDNILIDGLSRLKKLNKNIIYFNINDIKIPIKIYDKKYLCNISITCNTLVLLDSNTHIESNTLVLLDSNTHIESNTLVLLDSNTHIESNTLVSNTNNKLILNDITDIIYDKPEKIVNRNIKIYNYSTNKNKTIQQIMNIIEQN
jgi:hypothetical protein